MEERELQKLLIDIIRSELTCTALDGEAEKKLTPDIIGALYRLSELHDLAHIVSAALGKLGLLGVDEISAGLQKQELLSVYRCERLKYEFEQICEVLDGESIPYIPLKGSVIRPFYPYDSMRTSCDIDILIREEQLDNAIDAIVERLAYERGSRDKHDVALNAPSGVHFELHFSLIEGDEVLDAVLLKVWEYSTQKSEYRYAMTDEFLLFYHISHMAKHFAHGGCGIRPFMDLWIIEHKMGISRNCADELLEASGLCRFAVGAFALADAWFGGKEHTELTLNMQEYIMNAGVYGSLENRVYMRSTDNDSKLKYIFRRVFIPYRDMVNFFPSLKKCPLLLPFLYLVRIFRVVRGKRLGRRIHEAKLAGTLSDESMDKVNSLRNELGI